MGGGSRYLEAKPEDIGQTWREGRALAVLRLSRPTILLAGVVANLAGLAMAHYALGTVDLRAAALSLMVLLMATAMGHFLNEYADVDTDSLTRRTLISGGSGVLPSGIIDPAWALMGAGLCALGSLLLTISGLLTGLLSFSYLAMVLLAIVLGYCYSMPPLRLERKGWGEVDNAFLGTLMFLSGYLPQAGTLSLDVAIWSAPIFLSIMVNLIGVHWSDRVADEAVGKRTLIVRLGERSMLLFPALLVVTYSVIVVLRSAFPSVLLGAYALTVPVGIWAYRTFRRTGSPYPGSAFMVAVLLGNLIGWSL
jgi:1,4-dihydroxy-2-naphthoate polyprenyltransferase